ncbi:MAG: hypothetical protein R6V40_04740 [Candidatus Moraniibacteriota bacterium]
MSGLFGINARMEIAKGEVNPANDLYWGTFYQQHLGEMYCGIAIFDQEQRLKTINKDGRFGDAFRSEKSLWETKLTTALGYCGVQEAPFSAESISGKFSLCFTGNITNKDQLKNYFLKQGNIFTREGDEIELLSKIIATELDVVEGLKAVARYVKGACSILVATEDSLYAYSDSHWPLVVGKKNGEIVVATSSCGFGNLGFELIEDLENRIIQIQEGEVKRQCETIFSRPCSFMWVYTGFPTDIMYGLTASEVRKKLGSLLAKKDIAKGFFPDIVAPVADSGIFHAIGYHQEWLRQINLGLIDRVPFYDKILLKYPFAGRSFTPPNQEIREMIANVKQIASGESFAGKKVVLVDDSIVRGTQMRTNLVPKVKTLHPKEIHIRIGNPELLADCPWGKTIKKGECLALSVPEVEERRKLLGVDSLVYNSKKELDEIFEQLLPGVRLCMDCSKNGN